MQLTEKTSMSFGVTLTACLIGEPKRRDDERNAWHEHERYVGDSDCKAQEKDNIDGDPSGYPTKEGWACRAGIRTRP